MNTIAAIEAELEAGLAAAAADDVLALGERALEVWLLAHDKQPTQTLREGFRLLALHRQSAQGDPSFNACRETCREIAYRYNLVRAGAAKDQIVTMRRLVRHLVLFISGKLQSAQLGEFCCSSRAIREADR